ncbi:MAG: sigma-54-dependent transcriptional regulator [Terriglobales bacterium]
MNGDFRIRFLIVDDEPTIRTLCTRIAESLGFLCLEAESAEAALRLLESDSPEVVVTDLRLPQKSGVELLERIKSAQPRTEVAIMTGHGSIDSAVEAMRLGAYHYITKPFAVEEMKLILERMAEKVRLVAERDFLRERVNAETELNEITGSSPRIQDVLRLIGRLKDTRTPVLITGESGTGKELVARAIHFRGPFAQRPFVAVDCSSLVPTLIESELFGYEKGAFTGALKSRPGLFQTAHGGTIFLDEVGELPQEMQAKLLRVLQEKELRPVGSNDNVKVDVRVIAASNRDLDAAYRAGAFRKDLYFRLNVVAVHVPPLRERKSDIPSLVRCFLDRFAPDSPLAITAAAMNALLQYDWPGNVRELENCIERAVALRNHDRLDVADLPSALCDSPASTIVSEPFAPEAPTDLEHLERITIQRVFEQVHGDKTLAGKMLGISRATLYRKLKRYNIGVGPSPAPTVGMT